MSSNNKTWQNVKAGYLHQVEKALASVSHPRKQQVLKDIQAHLEQRFSELGADDQTWENFQKIITDMGPPTDYAELLEPDNELRQKKGLSWQKSIIILVCILAVITPALWLLLRDQISYREDESWKDNLNEGQRIYMEWTQIQFANYLDKKEYAGLMWKRKKIS